MKAKEMAVNAAQAVTTGRCLCGFVCFEVSGEVEAAAYCHCSDCRKCTGSAFVVSFPVPTTHFKLVSGAPKPFTKTGDSGHELTRHFCPECGSPLFTSSPRHPDRIYVKAGVLDDPAVIKPAYQSWVASSVSWATIAPTLPRFEKSRRQALNHGTHQPASGFKIDVDPEAAVRGQS